MVSHNRITHTEFGDFDLNKPWLGRRDIHDLRERLLEDKRQPIERRGLLCNGICMEAGHLEPMSVYVAKGVLIGRHKSRAGEKRHKATISPEHLAYQERTVTEAELGGFPAESEVWSDDRTIRTDTLVRGEVLLGVEVQRSDFPNGSVRTRADEAEAIGIVPAWHTDQLAISENREVAWTRTDNLPAEAIRNDRDLLVRSGVQNLRFERCDERALSPCPDRPGRRCGEVHPQPEPRPIQFGDFIRGAAAGLIVPFARRQGRGIIRTWVSSEQLAQYEDLLGMSAADALRRNGAPIRREQRRRSSHYSPTCRDRIARAAEGADESREAASASASLAPTGTCCHWIGAESRYCKQVDGVRRYIPGNRCPAHTPNALQGQPEIPPGPGWPKFRGVR